VKHYSPRIQQKKWRRRAEPERWRERHLDIDIPVIFSTVWGQDGKTLQSRNAYVKKIIATMKRAPKRRRSNT